MLLRSPSSLPISASVVELNPLREKHFAAAVRIAATRGFSQSTARGDVPLALVSADSLVAWGTLSAVFMVLLRKPTDRCRSSRVSGGVAAWQARRPSVRRVLPPNRFGVKPKGERPVRKLQKDSGFWPDSANQIFSWSVADRSPSASLRWNLWRRWTRNSQAGAIRRSAS